MPSIQLNQPPVGSTNWGNLVNANWQTIQDILNSRIAQNYLINGDFNIWQRFAPGSFNAANTYAGCVADRWYLTSSNAFGGDAKAKQDSSGYGTANGSQYDMQVENANGSFSRYVACSQMVESQVCYALRGRAVIFQAMLGQNYSGNVRMAIISCKGSQDTYSAAQLDCVNNWTYTDYTTNMGTGNKFFKQNQSGTNTATYTVIGVSSSIVTPSLNGTVYSCSGTVDANCTNLICMVWSESSIASTNYIAVQQAGLFDGSAIVPWLPRNQAQELAMCYRYCWAVGVQSTYNYIASAWFPNATNAYFMLGLPTSFRALPILRTTPGNWEATDAFHTSAFTTLAISPSSIYTYQNQLCLLGVNAAATWNTGPGLVLNAGNSGLIVLDAEFVG